MSEQTAAGRVGNSGSCGERQELFILNIEYYMRSFDRPRRTFQRVS